MNLIVEKGVFTEDEWQQEVIKKYFPNSIFLTRDEVLTKPFPTWEDWSFRGSFNLAAKFRANFDFYNCLYWMPNLWDFLLNKEFQFVDFARMKDSKFPAFVRPASGRKEFVGQVFETAEKFETEYRFATENQNVDKFLICVRASVQKIKAEYRFVFVNGKLIDGCEYLYKGEVNTKRIDAPKEAFDLARKISEHEYFLNRFEFVIDICQSDSSEFKLLEINDFRTSSFYFCDLDKIYFEYSKI